MPLKEKYLLAQKDVLKWMQLNQYWGGRWFLLLLTNKTKSVYEMQIRGWWFMWPGLRFWTSGPTDSTTPMNSCPQTSPFFIPGINPTYMCRSEPQMQVVVTFRMTSVCRNKWQAKAGERPGFNHVQQTTTILAFPWLALIQRRSNGIIRRCACRWWGIICKIQCGCLFTRNACSKLPRFHVTNITAHASCILVKHKRYTYMMRGLAAECVSGLPDLWPRAWAAPEPSWFSCHGTPRLAFWASHPSWRWLYK